MLLRRFFTFAVLAVGAVILFIQLLPSQVAQACLPCDCPTDRSLNCFGRFGVYTPVEKDGSCSILILDIDDDGRSSFALRRTAKQLAKLPEQPEENVLVGEYYEIALYKLTSGEYQVNVGPDQEGKVFVLNFSGCPAENVYESTFFAEIPASEAAPAE